MSFIKIINGILFTALDLDVSQFAGKVKFKDVRVRFIGNSQLLPK